MKTEVIIGIDAGSTHLKTGVYSLNGDLLSIMHHRVNLYHSLTGQSEYRPEEIFFHMCKNLKKQLSNIYRPIAVGISSFGESVIPIGKYGEPLSDMIAWFDMRGEELINIFAKKYGFSQLYHLTGQYYSGKYTLAKLLWLKEKQPELIRKVYCFLFMQDYLVYKLTGQLYTDYSLASRSMLYNITKKCWDIDLLSQCGLKASQLPVPIPSGSPGGTVTEAAALLTNLPAGIPVILAGHDHASASIAAGITDKNIALDSMGTSETALFSSPQIDTEKAYAAFLSTYPYLQNENRLIASIQGCGASIEWVAKLLFTKDIFSQFFQCAKSGEEYCTSSPITLPFFRGIQEYPTKFASVSGLKDFHAREHLCYSLLEGLCFEYLRRLEAGQQCCSTAFDTIRAVGRLSNQPVFMQLKANITGKRIEVLSQSEAVSQGAAVLAGLFCECISFWKPKINNIYFPSVNAEIYTQRYEEYIHLLHM